MSTLSQHDHEPGHGGVALTVVLAQDELNLLARHVADLIEDRRDDGFLDVNGAARFLATTPKAIYHLVERRRIRAHRLGGRLLFDPTKLREDVERGR
jgi:hypothetical protein